MNKDIEGLLGLRKILMDFHEKFYNYVSETFNGIKKHSPEELCDIAFLCRKMEVYCEELRKIAKGRKELGVKLIGFHLATQDLSDPGNCQDRIDGELAYARVTPRVIPKIPAKGDSNYVSFMKSLGIPENLLKGGLVKADFRSVSNLITEMVKNGEELPPGVEKTWTEYVANFYEKRK